MSKKPRRRKVKLHLVARDTDDAGELIKQLAEQFPQGDLDADIAVGGQNDAPSTQVADEPLETQMRQEVGRHLDQRQRDLQALAEAQAEHEQEQSARRAAKPPQPQQASSLVEHIKWVVDKGIQIAAHVYEVTKG